VNLLTTAIKRTEVDVLPSDTNIVRAIRYEHGYCFPLWYNSFVFSPFALLDAIVYESYTIEREFS